jgi:hypothetical protein
MIQGSTMKKRRKIVVIRAAVRRIISEVLNDALKSSLFGLQYHKNGQYPILRVK